VDEWPHRLTLRTFMKHLFLWPVLLVLLCGCVKRDFTAEGNGFFTRGNGVTTELRSANIDLYFEKSGRKVLIWRSLSLTSGWESIEKGLLFSAYNQIGNVGLFVSDENGVVVEITDFVIRAGDRAESVNGVSQSGGILKISLFPIRGAPAVETYTSEELMQLAKKRVAEGVKTTWGGLDYYR